MDTTLAALYRCVSTEQPMSHSLFVVDKFASRRQLVVVGISIISILVFVILLLTVFGLRYRLRFCPFFLSGGRPSSSVVKRTKKRVVIVLQSNSLYESTGGAGKTGPGSAGDDASGGAGGGFLLPLVRIDTGGGKIRQPSEDDVISVSDYEIPLDRDWEFPRKKFVLDIFIYIYMN